MLLEPQGLLEDAQAAHDPEEVVVAAEEDVQAHLNVVPVLVHPRADLAADEAPRLEDLHLLNDRRKRPIVSIASRLSLVTSTKHRVLWGGY